MMLWRITVRRIRNIMYNDIYAVLVLMFGSWLFVAAWLYLGYATVGNDLSKDKVVLIPRGKSLTEIADILAEAEVINYGYLFPAIAFVAEAGSSFKAGEYKFKAHATPLEVMDVLVKGEPYYRRITVIEGKTIKDVLEDIRVADGLKGEAPREAEEGSVLPETYFFVRGDNREYLLTRMQQAQDQLFEQLWEKRAKGNAYISNPRQAIILASIVEKETGKNDERKRVAAVFHNRLRKGMRLQSDPTVIYGITKGEYVLDRRLTRADLNEKTPYNTYKIGALPPTPICNPSRESIEAVLNPADSDDLYFVADGDGGHYFAKTLQEHTMNVKKYRTLRDSYKKSNEQ